MSQPTDEVALPDPVDAEPLAAEGAGTGPRNLGIALAIISAAQLMVVLDGTIVNIALPHIKVDLGFSQADLSWVVNAYSLAFGGLLLLGGRLGDLLGRRKVFMTGVVIFAVASLLGGIAQSETQMIGARVLQGLGAAIASPTALSLITTTFPAGPPRNRAFAVYAAMSGAGAAIGLILGGALTEISWRWTFFINVPIGLLVVALAPRFLAESERQRGRFDVLGAITGTAGLVSLVYGLTHAAPPNSWTDATTITYLAIGVVLLAVFLVVESRSDHALMPFRVLANRNRATTYVAMLAIGAALFSMFYFLGQYIQVVLGYSAIVTGLAFLPFSFGIVGAAQLSSALVARIDPRWIAGTGAVIAASGMFMLSRVSVGSSYFPDLIVPIMVLSVGMGLVFVPLTLTAVVGVPKNDTGIASAVLNTMQQIGGAIGLATLSTVAVNAQTAFVKDHAAGLAGAAQAGGAPAGESGTPLPQALFNASFTHGATQAFEVGAVIVLAGAVLVYTLLTISHRELANDEATPTAAL
jgi:EmrB/QacA subfamily drug resistance transporter